MGTTHTHNWNKPRGVLACFACKQVVTSVPADDFGVWMDEDFSPEDKFLEELKKIEGISQVETQMYTFQTL